MFYKLPTEVEVEDNMIRDEKSAKSSVEFSLSSLMIHGKCILSQHTL